MTTPTTVIDGVTYKLSQAVCDACDEFTTEPVEVMTFDADDICTYEIQCPTCAKSA